MQEIVDVATRASMNRPKLAKLTGESTVQTREALHIMNLTGCVGFTARGEKFELQGKRLVLNCYIGDPSISHLANFAGRCARSEALLNSRTRGLLVTGEIAPSISLLTIVIACRNELRRQDSTKQYSSHQTCFEMLSHLVDQGLIRREDSRCALGVPLATLSSNHATRAYIVLIVSAMCCLLGDSPPVDMSWQARGSFVLNSCNCVMPVL